MARRLSDDACLLTVWRTAILSTWVRDRSPAHVAEFPELLALAERVGDAEELVLTYVSAQVGYIELGDLDAADRLQARVTQVAAELNNPVLRWLEAAMRCGRLAVSGTGDEVEHVALEALQIGEDAGQLDAFLVFAAQIFLARWAQGRLGEVLDLVRQQTADNPGIPAWRAALAGTLVRLGHFDEAAPLVDELMADPPNTFPEDFLWLMSHAQLGEAVAVMGTAEQAEHEYELLAPYADRIPSILSLALPSISLCLGSLAARIGDPERAERHFAEAAAQHERLGALIWLARTRLEWGRFLLDQGETDRSCRLLREAHEGAERMGAVDIVAKARSLLGA
jgi:tetratricopeptide (TPR) repeat protein